MQKLSPLNLIKIGLFGLLFAVYATSGYSDNHDFIEVTFNDQDPPTREKTEYVWTGRTNLPKLNATFRFTDSSLYWWEMYYFIDDVRIGGATSTSQGVYTTPYGSWRDFPSPHDKKCFSGAHYQCNSVHFQPNSQAIANLQLGQELKIILLVRQWGPPRVETNTVITYIREDVSFNWRHGFNGEESNPSDEYDTFNWRYIDLTTHLSSVADLNFKLQIKDGLEEVETFTMTKGEYNSSWSGQEWYYRTDYGEWIIRSFGDCSTGSAKCSIALFKQNRQAINRLYGKNVRMWITVHHSGSNSQLTLSTLKYRIIGRSIANLSWDTSGAGDLKPDNRTIYDNIVGNGMIFGHSHRGITIQVAEKVTEQAEEIIGNRTNTIESNKRKYGGSFKYGSWWVDESLTNRATDPIDSDYFSAKRGFFFEPDSDAINQELQVGQTATSTLKFQFHVGNETSVIDKTDSISVTITRLPVVRVSLDKNTIKEGESFTYTISVDPAPTPNNPLDVYIEEEEINDPNGIANSLSSSSPTKVVTSATLPTTKTTQIRSSHFPDSKYTVRIKAHSSYLIKGANPANVEIENVEPVQISILTSTTSITEGETFDFTLTATPAPTAALSIALSEDDSNSGYFGSYSLSTFEIPTSGNLEVTVSTNLKPTYDPTVALTVSIDTNSSYIISPTAGSISVNIENIALPTISISSSKHDDTIVEGTSFNFTLVAIPPPTANLEVTLTAESTPAEYLADGLDRTVEIGTSGMVEVNVATIELSDDSNVGRVVIGLAEKPNSYLISVGEPSIIVSILKVGTPDISRISISSNSDGLNVVEGQTFMFQLLAEPAPTSNLTVNLTIVHAGFFNPTPFNSVIIPTSGRVEELITTKNILTGGNSENVMISIASSSDYFVSATKNYISFTIIDEASELTPTISIIPVKKNILMGEVASFDILANPVPPSAICVKLNVSYEGNILLWRAPTQLEVQGRHTLSLPTLVDRENLDASHNIKVKIDVGVGYNVSETGENTAIVFVGAIESAEASQNLPNISVASSVASSILTMMMDENQPESSSPTVTEVNSIDANIEPIISITAIKTRIQEGEYAEFKITSSVPSFVNVQIRITETVSFLTGPTPELIEFLGGNEVIVKLATKNDNLAEDDGMIQVALVDNSGYSISNSQKSATVLIDDQADQIKRQRQINAGVTNIYSEYMSAIGVNSLNVAVEQVNLALSDNSIPVLQFGGLQSTQDIIQSTGESINSNSISIRTFFDESSFSMQLLPAIGDTRSMRIWGRGDYWDLISGAVAN